MTHLCLDDEVRDNKDSRGVGGVEIRHWDLPLLDATALTTSDVPLDRTKVEKWEVPVPDLDAADSVKPGHLVTVAPEEAIEEEPRNAIVLEDVAVEADVERQVLVLYSAGGTEEVLVSRCARVMPPKTP